MWNRKNSTFLLVKVRVPSRFNLVFPLLLPLLDETLEEVNDWMAFWKWVYNREGSWLSNICSCLQAGGDMLREIRALGPMDMIEIKTPEAEIVVKLQ